jgi:hypothetical protein
VIRFAAFALALLVLVLGGHELLAGLTLAMPFVLIPTTNAAAGATVNPLIGSQFEVLPYDALVEFAIYADTGDTWTVSVFSGSDVLMQGSTAPILATAAPILYPDHYYLQDVAAAGERIGITAVNGTGAVADFRAAVRITPVPS